MTDAEKKKLKLNQDEDNKLKPYFTTSELKPYFGCSCCLQKMAIVIRLHIVTLLSNSMAALPHAIKVVSRRAGLSAHVIRLTAMHWRRSA